ncbi:MAG: transposase [Tannerellaceae bacterium]
MESKKRVYRRFSREEKIEILRTIYEGKMSKYAVCKKYNLWNSVLKGWIVKYSNELSLSETNPFDEVMGKSKNEKHQNVQSKSEVLQERIADLEKALAFEKMRSRGFEVMINIAETELTSQ